MNKFLEFNYKPVSKQYVGTYSSKKKKLTFLLDVAMIQSFDDGKESSEILSKYGLIICDEVHHLGAITYEKVIRNSSSLYTYGLTATIKRSDDTHGVVLKAVGKVVYEHKEDYKKSSIVKDMIPVFTKFKLYNLNQQIGHTEKCNILVKDEKRNLLILSYIKELLNSKKHILLLSERIKHLEYFYDEILKYTNNVYIITGQTSIKDRQDIINRINALKDESSILVSTGKSVGEGFDMPILDTLLITMPFKWEGTLQQNVGRLHRDYLGKNKVTVYDFIDPKVPSFYYMFSKRLRGYKKFNYNIHDKEGEKDTILYNNSNYLQVLNKDLVSASINVYFYISKYEDSTLNNYLEYINTNVIIYGDINIDINNNKIKFENFTHNYNLIIIDYSIVWYGDVNPFISDNFYKSIIRVEDKDFVKNLIDEIHSQKEDK